MKSLEKNFLYNILYQILIIILPLITAPYISRTLGVEAVGIYSYTYSVTQYFLLFAMLGIASHGNRVIAANSNDKELLEENFWSIYSIQLFSFTIAIVFYLLYMVLFKIDNTLIVSFQFIYVLSGLFDISWYFFGTEQFKITVTRNTIIKVLTVIAMFVFVKQPTDLWKYTIIMSLGTLLSQLYLWKYLKKQIRFRRVRKANLKNHIKPIMILFVPVLSYSIYKIMDKVMLGNMTDYSQVGYYENAGKIISIPMGIITALGIVMLPRMSNIAAKGEHDKTKQFIRVSIKLVTIIGSAIMFGLIGTSKILAPVYFGAEFKACGSLIRLLSVTVLFISWANVVRTQFLIPYHKDNVYLHSMIIGALINLITNILLIPKFQGNGAAIGTILAEFTVMVVQVFKVRKDIDIWKYIRSTIPYIIIGGVMAFVVNTIGYILGIHLHTLVIQIIIGGIVYCFLCLLYLLFSKDEMGTIIYKKMKSLRSNS